MSKLIKISLLMAVLVFAVALTTSSQETSPEVTEAIELDENIQPEDLGVGDPRLLPDNPFYFLKNWARGIQSFFTFNPVAKAALKLKFANEKLMEVKKIIGKTQNPEIIKRATENYETEIEKIKEAAEKIKEKAKENPKVESFLDKYTRHQILHQNLLQRLEEQVPAEVFEKIKEARERHLERFKDVMLKLEDKDKIGERLEENMEQIKGSKYKNFKNLEILMELEQKLPEEAKEAIRKAQENSLKRLGGDLEKMSPEDQEKFKEYLEKISGEKEKHLEILENLKSEIKLRPETPQILKLKEKLEEGKVKIFEKIEARLEKINCPLWTPPAPGFCKEGRIIVGRNSETGCPLPPKCIIPGEAECQVFITCEEGYISYNTGERDSQGCPIMKCIKEEEVEKPTAVCITLWNPVCGKNGKTYSNACFAKVAGAEIAYKGECKEKECRTDADCPQPRCGPLGTISARCLGVKAKCVEGKCQIQAVVSPPVIESEMLWWYDDDHRYCQQKEFRGMYMYQGLRTFKTKAECEAALPKEDKPNKTLI